MENKKCTSCQCAVTKDDVENQLGNGTVPEDGILGTIEGTGEQVQVSNNDTTYLEPNVTIDVGSCVECMCLANYSFVCEKRDPCVTTTVASTTPFCRGPWTEWSPCPFSPQCEGAVSTRNRTCNTADPACNCTSNLRTQIQDCVCETTTGTTSTTTPFTSEKACFTDCWNECTDTCKHQSKHDCVFTTSSGRCRCKKCAPGQLTDSLGRCITLKECPCYLDTGEEVPIGYGKNYTENCEYCSCNHERKWVCKKIPGCCKTPEIITTWSTCDAACGNGTRKRLRINCSSFKTEREPCYTPPPEQECSVCTCTSDNKVNCTEKTGFGNATWTVWSEWSLCVDKKNCRDYKRTRCRTCERPKCGPKVKCDGDPIETERCSATPCCDVFEWSAWSDCSASCGTGKRTRTKQFHDAATTRDCMGFGITEVEECGKCSCEDSTVLAWSQWTTCTTTGATQCGWGIRTRNRVATKCDGVPTLQTEECFISPCACEQGYEYSNHSQCAPTCQHPDPDPACSLKVEPKCVCGGNMFMDQATKKCVPKEKCHQCVYNNVTYEPGDRWECNECDYCSCCAGNILTERKKCANITDCDLTTHQLVPSNSSCCPVDCVPKKCQLKTKPEPQRISRSGCISKELFPVQYCSGPCEDSKVHLNYVTGTFEHECHCCAARVLNVTTVMLDCPGGNTLEHRFPIISECFCDVTTCMPGQ